MTGFIGMTLESTPTLVAQAGIRDVELGGEVTTANLAAKDLRRRGVTAIVVLLRSAPVGRKVDPASITLNGDAAAMGPWSWLHVDHMEHFRRWRG